MGKERELAPRGRLSVASGLCLGPLISIASEINVNVPPQHTPTYLQFMYVGNETPPITQAHIKERYLARQAIQMPLLSPFLILLVSFPITEFILLLLLPFGSRRKWQKSSVLRKLLLSSLPRNQRSLVL